MFKLLMPKIAQMQAFWIVNLYQSLPFLWSMCLHVIDHFYWVCPLSRIALGTVVLNDIWQTFCKSNKKNMQCQLGYTNSEHIRYRSSHEILPLRRRPSRVHCISPNKQLRKLLRTRSLLRTVLMVAALILGAPDCWATQTAIIAIKRAVASIDFAILKFSMFLHLKWTQCKTINNFIYIYCKMNKKNSFGNGQWTSILFFKVLSDEVSKTLAASVVSRFLEILGLIPGTSLAGNYSCRNSLLLGLKLLAVNRFTSTFGVQTSIK